MGASRNFLGLVGHARGGGCYDHGPQKNGQIVLGTALGAASIVSEQAWTQEAFPRDLPDQCTLEKVAGIFGFNEETSSSPGAQEARAIVGLIDLHSDGTALLQTKGLQGTGRRGAGRPDPQGEWTVEPNCFGLIDFPEVDAPAGSTVEFDLLFVAVENATELFFVLTIPLKRLTQSYSSGAELNCGYDRARGARSGF